MNQIGVHAHSFGSRAGASGGAHGLEQNSARATTSSQYRFPSSPGGGSRYGSILGRDGLDVARCDVAHCERDFVAAQLSAAVKA